MSVSHVYDDSSILVTYHSQDSLSEFDDPILDAELDDAFLSLDMYSATNKPQEMGLPLSPISFNENMQQEAEAQSTDSLSAFQSTQKLSSSSSVTERGNIPLARAFSKPSGLAGVLTGVNQDLALKTCFRMVDVITASRLEQGSEYKHFLEVFCRVYPFDDEPKHAGMAHQKVRLELRDLYFPKKPPKVNAYIFAKISSHCFLNFLYNKTQHSDDNIARLIAKPRFKAASQWPYYALELEVINVQKATWNTVNWTKGIYSADDETKKSTA
jgi:hypothetical protein